MFVSAAFPSRTEDLKCETGWNSVSNARVQWLEHALGNSVQWGKNMVMVSLEKCKFSNGRHLTSQKIYTLPHLSLSNI